MKKLSLILLFIPLVATAFSFRDLRDLFSFPQSNLSLGAAVRVFTPSQGGTGIGSATASDVGKFLQVSDDSPFTYIFATGGGGSSGGTWSTTTSSVAGQFINFPNNNDDIVAIGSNSTTTAEFWFDPNFIDAFLTSFRATNSTTTNATTTGRVYFGEPVKLVNNYIATTTTVCAYGCDYTSIDTAVDTVTASTTILIKNGTYALGTGTITVAGGKTLEIIGESKDGVIITYSGGGAAFTIGDSTTVTRNFRLENVTIIGSSSGTRGFSFVNVRNSYFANLKSVGFSSAINPGQAFRLDGTGGYTGDNVFYYLLCDTSEFCLNLSGTAVNSNHFYGFTLRTTGTAASRAIALANSNGNTFYGGLVSAGQGFDFAATADENRVDGTYCEANTTCVNFDAGAAHNQVSVVDVESNTTVVTDAGNNNNVTYTGSDGGGQTYFNAGKFGIGTSSPYAALSVVGQVVGEYFTATSTTATSTFNQVKITAQHGVGTVANSSGIFFLDNTNNPEIGANFYSNAGSGQSVSLVFMKQDNALADTPPLRIDNDGTGVALKINQNNSGNFQGGIRVDGANPDIEFVDTDEVAPAGKFEHGVRGNQYYIGARNADDNGFEMPFVMNGVADGNNVGLSSTTPRAKLSVHLLGTDTTRFPLLIGSSTAAFATTTIFSVNNIGAASTTATSTFAGVDLRGYGLLGAGLAECSGDTDTLGWENGYFTCGDDDSAAGGGSNSKWSTSTDTTSIFANPATKVGIGTTSPFSKLSVSSAAQSTEALFTVASTTHAEMFSVASNGLTKIATSTGVTLDVANIFTITPTSGQGVFTFTGGSAGQSVLTSGASGRTAGESGVYRVNAINRDLRLGVGTSGTTDVISITNTGQFVGIGTTSPQWPLQIASSTAFTLFRPQLTLTDTNAGVDAKHWNLTSASGELSIGTSSDTTFATSTRLKIDVSGLLSAFGGILVNSATSTITNLVMVNSTSTNATSTQSHVSTLFNAVLARITDGIFSTSLQIPNSTGPTVDTTGEIAVDTTTGQFLVFDGSDKHVLTGTSTMRINLASTTMDINGRQFKNGTTSLGITNDPEAITLSGFYCKATSTAASTQKAVIRFGDGTNWGTSGTCDTTGSYTANITNNTFTSFEDVILQASSTGTVAPLQRIVITPVYQKTAD